MSSPWGYRTMTARCPYDFMSPSWASCGDLAATLRVPYDERKSLRSFFGKNDNLKSRVVLTITRTMHVRGSYDVSAMCLRATGLRFFQICHCAELSKTVEAMMPVNPYDDRNVTLRRPHGNGDLDIVRTSYTRRKANVTEALILA